jgi:hypothetical protein
VRRLLRVLELQPVLGPPEPPVDLRLAHREVGGQGDLLHVLDDLTLLELPEGQQALDQVVVEVHPRLAVVLLALQVHEDVVVAHRVGQGLHVVGDREGLARGDDGLVDVVANQADLILDHGVDLVLGFRLGDEGGLDLLLLGGGQGRRRVLGAGGAGEREEGDAQDVLHGAASKGSETARL